MDHIFAFSHVQARYLALGPRFGVVLGPRGRLSWLLEVDLEDFEILGGAGDIRLLD